MQPCINFTEMTVTVKARSAIPAQSADALLALRIGPINQLEDQFENN
jgi:hypothetical protein